MSHSIYRPLEFFSTQKHPPGVHLGYRVVISLYWQAVLHWFKYYLLKGAWVVCIF